MPSRQGGGGNGDPAKRRPAAASTDVWPCHWEPRVGSCSGAVGEGRQHLPVFYQSRGMVGPGSAAVDHERTDRGRERGGAHEGCCSAARTYPIDSIGCWAPLRLVARRRAAALAHPLEVGQEPIRFYRERAPTRLSWPSSQFSSVCADCRPLEPCLGAMRRATEKERHTAMPRRRWASTWYSSF